MRLQLVVISTTKPLAALEYPVQIERLTRLIDVWAANEGVSEIEYNPLTMFLRAILPPTVRDLIGTCKDCICKLAGRDQCR